MLKFQCIGDKRYVGRYADLIPFIAVKTWGVKRWLRLLFTNQLIEVEFTAPNSSNILSESIHAHCALVGGDSRHIRIPVYSTKYEWRYIDSELVLALSHELVHAGIFLTYPKNKWHLMHYYLDKARSMGYQSKLPLQKVVIGNNFYWIHSPQVFDVLDRISERYPVRPPDYTLERYFEELG